MSAKSHATVNRDFVLQVGGHVLATQLSAQRDPATIANDHLDKLADLSVRAAIALDAAIPRAEERLAAEAKAAEEAEIAAKETKKAEEAAAAKAAKEESDANKAAAAAERAAEAAAEKEAKKKLNPL